MGEEHNFKRELEKFKKTIVNKTIKAAQKEALKPLAQRIKANAPVDSGELKKGVKVKAGNRKKDTIITNVVVNTPEENPHAARVELGTKSTSAKPFVRPAVASMSKIVIDRFAQALSEAIEKL